MSAERGARWVQGSHSARCSRWRHSWPTTRTSGVSRWTDSWSTRTPIWRPAHCELHLLQVSTGHERLAIEWSSKKMRFVSCLSVCSRNVTNKQLHGYTVTMYTVYNKPSVVACYISISVWMFISYIILCLLTRDHCPAVGQYWSYFFFRIADPSQRENLGIIVQYKVKVKLCLGPLGG